MLLSSKHYAWNFRIFFQAILIGLLSCSSCKILANHSADKPQIQEWIVRYFECVDENTSLDEAIDAILSYKLSLQAKGFEIPPVYLMMNFFENLLKANGAPVDNEMLEFLQNEFYKRESQQCEINPACSAEDVKAQIIQVSKKSKDKKKKHKKGKDDWEFKFTRKSMFGLLKCVAGTLCVLVPHPVASGVGTALIADGIKDIFEDERDSKYSDEIADERARIDRSLGKEY